MNNYTTQTKNNGGEKTCKDVDYNLMCFPLFLSLEAIIDLKNNPLPDDKKPEGRLYSITK